MRAYMSDRVAREEHAPDPERAWLVGVWFDRRERCMRDALREAERILRETEPCRGVVGEQSACREPRGGYHNMLSAFAHEPWYSQIPEFAEPRMALAVALRTFVDADWVK